MPIFPHVKYHLLVNVHFSSRHSSRHLLQEQANEREQEHEDYQKELDKWKKIVQDIEKQNGYESRLQNEVY